jgi:hypothetical protein
VVLGCCRPPPPRDYLGGNAETEDFTDLGKCGHQHDRSSRVDHDNGCASDHDNCCASDHDDCSTDYDNHHSPDNNYGRTNDDHNESAASHHLVANRHRCGPRLYAADR